MVSLEGDQSSDTVDGSVHVDGIDMNEDSERKLQTEQLKLRRTI